MTTGSCLCVNVTYEFSTPVSGIIHCHCATCCKAHVSALPSVARVPTADFKLVGAEHLGSFESSHGRLRHFCSNCGTRVYAQRESKRLVILRLVSLDIPFDANELAHSWTLHSMDWFDLYGYLPRYAEEMSDYVQAADIEHDTSSKKWSLIARRLLPVPLFFAMSIIGLGSSSGALIQKPAFSYDLPDFDSKRC